MVDDARGGPEDEEQQVQYQLDGGPHHPRTHEPGFFLKIKIIFVTHTATIEPHIIIIFSLIYTTVVQLSNSVPRTRSQGLAKIVLTPHSIHIFFI